MVAPRDAAIPLSDYTTAMTAEGVPYEHLDGVQIMRRWPQWRLGDEHHGLYQADSGIADPNRGNAAHQRLARQRGATLLEHSPVARLRDAGGGELEVEVEDGTVHRSGRVVLATDAAPRASEQVPAFPGQHVRIGHLVGRLGLQHQDVRIRLGDEIRLVFEVVVERRLDGERASNAASATSGSTVTVELPGETKFGTHL